MTYIVALISLMFMANSCKSSKDHSPQNPAPHPSQTETPSDTIPAIAPTKPALPPGQVRLVAAMISLEPSDQSKSAKILRLRIIRISKYGPSTPPLSPGDTLAIAVVKEFDDIATEDSIKVGLQHDISLEGTPGGVSWSLINIES
ncbi:hypothetical protein [Fodinibius sediminis]|uniref:Uncharacterized protein n=1 Tax=Fodinibius sediminis TaxID=1214077 RepID=A0A521F4K8_9BACT|nr:hypothetical protein [Fodinibius sediminis]SMO91147.1 hypothetical protein SAMN06265218_12324 [Fodinibius sediminis]